MFKKEEKIIINDRGTKHFGVVQNRKRREEIVYYDVVVNGFKLYEGLTTNTSMPCYVDSVLSKKLQNQILTPLV